MDSALVTAKVETDLEEDPRAAGCNVDCHLGTADKYDWFVQHGLGLVELVL